jgi:hypothetical protein
MRIVRLRPSPLYARGHFRFSFATTETSVRLELRQNCVGAEKSRDSLARQLEEKDLDGITGREDSLAREHPPELRIHIKDRGTSLFGRCYIGAA